MRHLQITGVAQPDWRVRKNRPHSGTRKKWPVVYLSLARHRPASDAINTVSAAMSRRRCGWFYNVELLNSLCTAEKQLWRHMVQSPDDDWRETNNLEFPLRDSTCRAGGAPRVIRKHKFHTKVCLCQFHTEDRFHVNFPDSFAYMHVLHRGLLSHKSFVNDRMHTISAAAPNCT